MQIAYKPLYLAEVEKNKQLEANTKLMKLAIVVGAVANIVLWAIFTVVIN